MKTFNFLPWRKVLARQQQKKLQHGFVLSFIVGALIVLGAHYFLQQNIKMCQQEITTLSVSPVQAVATQNAENLAIKNILDSIFMYRNNTNALLQAMGSSFIRNVCFTALERQDDQMVFSGHASSVADLMRYFKQWRAANYFSEIKVEQLVKNGTDNEIDFRFRGLTNDVAPKLKDINKNAI